MEQENWNWKCFLFGHTSRDHFEDWYYTGELCARCKTPSWWDNEYYFYGLMNAPRRLILETKTFLRDFVGISRCVDCKKIDILFNKRFGNHDDCVPF